MESEACTNLNWIFMTKDHDKEFKDKVLKMYKARPLKTSIETFEKLSSYYPCNNIILCDSDDEPNGGIMWWQSDYGNKISTSFAISQFIYKKYIIPKYIELLNIDGYYAELSEALEHLIRKEGIENIKDPEIIKKVIKVNKADIFDVDDDRRKEYPLGKNMSPIGSYLRIINDVGFERKALYGKPCMSSTFIGNNCNKICKDIIKLEGGSRKMKKNKRSKNKIIKNKNKTKSKRKHKRKLLNS